MDDQLDVEEPVPSGAPPRSPVAKRRSRHPVWDLGVPLLAIGAVVGAIVLVRPLRNAVQRHFVLVQRVSGTVMVVMGVLIFTGALIEVFRYFQAVNVVL